MANKPSRTLQVLAENLERLMAEREEYKTQTKVAKKAKVDQTTVSRILQALPAKVAEAKRKAAESGELGMKYHEPSIDKIEAIAKVFDLDAWQLLLPGLQPGDRPEIRRRIAMEVEV